jgi:hypothetical protein
MRSAVSRLNGVTDSWPRLDRLRFPEAVLAYRRRGIGDAKKATNAVHAQTSHIPSVSRPNRILRVELLQMNGTFHRPME